MKTLKQRCGMVLILCTAIAACSTNRGYDSNSASNMSNSGSSMGSGTGGSSVGAASGVSDAGNAATAGSAGVGTGSSMASTSSSTSAGYGTVQSIDPDTRQDIGVGTLGAAAAGGSMGSPGDKVYRVTVRMDDGSTQSMVVDSMPSSYKVGDRVRYSNGSLQPSTQ
jgi:hypothetical protein